MKILMVGLDKNSLGEDFLTVGEVTPGKPVKLSNIITGEKVKEVWKMLTEVKSKEKRNESLKLERLFYSFRRKRW